MANKLSPDHERRIKERYDFRIERGIDHDTAVKAVLGQLIDKEDTALARALLESFK